MFPKTVELAWRTFQQHRDPRALAIVFDRTAKDLLAIGRHLGSPGTDAEDLVQATFVTAIEDAASHRHGAALLPWLVGILANHARAARRRSRRAVDAARLPQPVADAGDEVAVNEVKAELRAAIDRLPEVYRPVLRLVFEHGLQAQEIARTLERPAGTVRAQVTRGIDLLRRYLPASLAGSAAVMAATGRGLAAVRSDVLGRVGGTGTGFVSALTLGGLLVLHHKLGAALAAVALAVLGFYWFAPEPAAPALATTSAAQDPTVASAPLPDPPSPERSTAAAALGPEAVAEKDPQGATAAAATGELLVRVVDAKGTPCAGIGVDVLPSDAMQDLGRNSVHRPTDARGEVHFANLAPRQWAIDVDRAGIVQVAFLTAGERAEQTVTLSAGITARGHVRDRAGAPIPGATVVLVGSRAANVVVASADAAGAFVVEHLAQGLELQARTPGRQPSLAAAVRGSGPAELSVDLVIGDPARTITGRVLDPDGHPVVGAVVAVLPAEAARLVPAAHGAPQPRATWLRSDLDGAFRCDEAANGASLVFTDAIARGFAPAWVVVDASSGAAFADVRLGRGARLEGTVRRDGKPMAFAQVALWPLEEPPIGYLLNLFGQRSATTDAEGEFRLHGLLPLRQSARAMLGNGTLLEQQEIALRDGETTTWNVDTQRGNRLAILVEGDESLVRLRLVAFVTNTALRDGEIPQVVTIGSNRMGSHTGPRKEPVDVVLAQMPGGSSLLQLAAVRNVPPSERAVRFALSPRDVPSRSIRGRLVDANAAPLGNEPVVAVKASTDNLVVRVEATTGADGTFALGPLPAGDYTLLAGPLRTAQPIGNVVLTNDRDEQAGDLVIPPRGQ